ncbi:hypothetical protein ACRALDRAFT_212984 [Sodiomyces alcalophilus JCM 7366]|uniref:uncharacterized protein n=1 Tax=Sodiomyces alcalophilus JCM 7366 TaxID=591952 RepID=UPI0039B6E911
MQLSCLIYIPTNFVMNKVEHGIKPMNRMLPSFTETRTVIVGYIDRCYHLIHDESQRQEAHLKTIQNGPNKNIQQNKNVLQNKNVPM